MDFGQRETVPMTEETAHSFLQRRRRELEAQISALKGQLVPKQDELAQIDKMLTAAGPPPAVAPALPQRNDNAAVQFDYAAAAQSLQPFLESAIPSAEAMEKMRGALEAWESSQTKAILRSMTDPISRFTAMTIKELVVQAIIDHFPNGGKISDIREFIRNGYGREIDQASLRPQMHRLKADGVLIQEGEIWNMERRKRGLYAMYDHRTSRTAMRELKDDAISDDGAEVSSDESRGPLSYTVVEDGQQHSFPSSAARKTLTTRLKDMK